MNFWIPYLLGFFSFAASFGVFLLGHCLRLAGERDQWMSDAKEMAKVLIGRELANEPPMEIVMRGGIPVVLPVEWPTELKVNR